MNMSNNGFSKNKNTYKWLALVDSSKLCAVGNYQRLPQNAGKKMVGFHRKAPVRSLSKKVKSAKFNGQQV